MEARVPGYRTDKGIAIMMEHLSLGMGGRHRHAKTRQAERLGALNCRAKMPLRCFASWRGKSAF